METGTVTCCLLAFTVVDLTRERAYISEDIPIYAFVYDRV